VPDNVIKGEVKYITT